MSDRGYLRQRARAELRGQIELSQAAIAGISTEMVGRALGLRHEGLMQRMTRSRRLAPRIAQILVAKNMLDPRKLVPELPAPPAVAEEQIAPAFLPGAIALPGPAVDMAPQAKRLLADPAALQEVIRRAGLAVAVRAMGGMLVKDDYVRLVGEYGDVPVAFALMIRAKAPALKLKARVPAEQALSIYGQSCLMALARQDMTYALLADRLEPAMVLAMSEDAGAQASQVARRAIDSVVSPKGDIA